MAQRYTKVMLDEKEIPAQWYNILPDLPQPPLHPGTRARNSVGRVGMWVSTKGGYAMRALWKAVTAASVLLAFGLTCTLAHAQTAQLAGPTRGSTLHLAYSPTVRSEGMGGASIAVEGPDSFNPAALGWLEEGKIEFSFGDYDFRSGPHVNYYRADVTYPVLGGGAKLKAYYFDSNRRLSKMEAPPGVRREAKVWGHELGVDYGRQINNRVSIGVGVYPQEESNLRLSGWGRGRAESLVGSARLGALVRVTDNINLATMFDHIKDRLKDSLDSGAAPHDDYYANIWTIGGAFKLDEKTLLAMDYRWGRVNGGDVRLNPRSPNFGLEYKLTENFTARIGQTRGNITAGAGYKLFGRWEINYAYVDGAGEGRSYVVSSLAEAVTG